MYGLSSGFSNQPVRNDNDSRPTLGESSGASSPRDANICELAEQNRPDSLQLFKPDSITAKPLLPNARGKFVPTKFTVGQALAKLDQRFPRQPDGPLSSMIRQTDPSLELNPRLTIALLSARTMSGLDALTARIPAERSMLAQERTNFPFNTHPVLGQNHGREAMPTLSSYSNIRKLSKNAIKAYYEKGVLAIPKPSASPVPTVLEVGAGYGSTAKYLNRDGFNVTSIDPNIKQNLEKLINWKRYIGKPGTESKIVAKIAELQKILPTTVEAYAKQYPNKKFDVVHVSNTAPTATTQSSLKSMVHAISQLTAPSGKALIGFSNHDPHFITNPEYPAIDILQKNFKKIKYIDASACDEFKENYSVGGMVGFFECKKPKK